MMEAARTSETSVDNHFTRQYNPEDSSEQIDVSSVFAFQNSTELDYCPQFFYGNQPQLVYIVASVMETFAFIVPLPRGYNNGAPSNCCGLDLRIL
jgi:hypothetical protein